MELLARRARALDPLPIMTVSELVAELRRRALPLPERGPWDTDPIYAGMCAEVHPPTSITSRIRETLLWVWGRMFLTQKVATAIAASEEVLRSALVHELRKVGQRTRCSIWSGRSHCTRDSPSIPHFHLILYFSLKKPRPHSYRLIGILVGTP